MAQTPNDRYAERQAKALEDIARELKTIRKLMEPNSRPSSTYLSLEEPDAPQR